MIQTYPNFYDQTQIIGLPGIIEYHGIAEVTPYPLDITITESLEFGILITETLALSNALYPSGTSYPSDTLYPFNGLDLTVVESLEYSIMITESGGS